MLCDQVAMLAESQARERERMEKETRDNMEALRQSVNQMSQRLATVPQSTGLVPPGLPQHNQSTWQPNINTVGLSSHIAQGPPQTQTNNTADVSSQGIHPLVNSGSSTLANPPIDQTITPEALQAATDPVRTLRRHRPSVNHATAVLRELALLEAGTKRRQGPSTSGKCNSQSEADWPDLYVYRLGGNEPTYDTLSLAEFVAGYLSIMEESTTVCPINTNLLNHISYLRQLMEDSFLSDWHIVRTAHKHVLNAIEHRRFTWSDTEKVMETKRIVLNRMHNSHPSTTFMQQSSAQVPAPQQGSPSVVCMAYQTLACPMLGDHDLDGTMHMHCCSFCLNTNGCKHLHPQSQCRKSKEAKKQGGQQKSGKRQKKE